MIKTHINFPGYFFTTNGEIISKQNKRPMKPGYRGKGYSGTVLVNTIGKRVTVSVHRVLAEVFIEKPSILHNQINHKNGIKTDNRIENLEWVTQSQNIRHKLDVLKKKNLKLQDHPRALFTDKDIKTIKILLKDCKYGDVARIAKQYGVHSSTISKIKMGKNWGEI